MAAHASHRMLLLSALLKARPTGATVRLASPKFPENVSASKACRQIKRYESSAGSAPLRAVRVRRVQNASHAAGVQIEATCGPGDNFFRVQVPAGQEIIATAQQRSVEVFGAAL